MTANGVESEKLSPRSFGMRNFKYIDTIKKAVESECPQTVSCSDIVALSARDGFVLVCINLLETIAQSKTKIILN